MNCPDDNLQAISAYHDGELADAAAARLQLHIEDCPACRAELKRLEDVSTRISAIEIPHLDGEALGRIKSGFDPRRDRLVLRVSKAVTGLAASIAIVCSVMLWYRHSATSVDMSQWETAATTVVPDQASVWASQYTDDDDPDVQLAWYMLDDETNEGGYDDE